MPILPPNRKNTSQGLWRNPMVNTVFSIVTPSYQVWDIEEWPLPAKKCIQGTFLESVNVILSTKRVLDVVIQDLEMDRSSWVIQISPKSYDKCPYKRDDGGWGMTEDSQRRRYTQREICMKTEARLECRGSKPKNPDSPSENGLLQSPQKPLCQHLCFGLWTPKLQENTFLSF